MQTGNVRDARQSSSADGGKPEILFKFFLKLLGFQSKTSRLMQIPLEMLKKVLVDHHLVWINKDLHELLKYYLQIQKLNMSTKTDDVFELFATLLMILGNDNFKNLVLELLTCNSSRQRNNKLK